MRRDAGFLDLFRVVSFVVLLSAVAIYAVVAAIDVATGHGYNAPTDLMIFFTLATFPCLLLTPGARRSERQDAGLPEFDDSAGAVTLRDAIH